MVGMRAVGGACPHGASGPTWANMAPLGCHLVGTRRAHAWCGVARCCALLRAAVLRAAAPDCSPSRSFMEVSTERMYIHQVGAGLLRSVLSCRAARCGRFTCKQAVVRPHGLAKCVPSAAGSSISTDIYCRIFLLQRSCQSFLFDSPLQNHL